MPDLRNSSDDVDEVLDIEQRERGNEEEPDGEENDAQGAHWTQRGRCWHITGQQVGGQASEKGTTIYS